MNTHGASEHGASLSSNGAVCCQHCVNGPVPTNVCSVLWCIKEGVYHLRKCQVLGHVFRSTVSKAYKEGKSYPPYSRLRTTPGGLPRGIIGLQHMNSRMNREARAKTSHRHVCTASTHGEMRFLCRTLRDAHRSFPTTASNSACTAACASGWQATAVMAMQNAGAI